MKTSPVRLGQSLCTYLDGVLIIAEDDLGVVVVVLCFIFCQKQFFLEPPVYNAWNLSSLDTINGQNKEMIRKERREEGREER